MAADDALVTPLHRSIPTAIDRRTQDHYQNEPKAMPCTVTKIIGEFVEVKIEAKSGFTFPKIVIPQAMSAYIREPTQVGDKGWAIPADFYLGGQSGDAGGTASLYPRSNLTPLVFQHISQKSFSSRNLNALFLNGPGGVVLQDTGGACSFTLTPTGIVISVGGNTITINGAGINVSSGTIVNQGHDIGSTHEHSGVTPGGSNTGPPL